MPDLNLSSKWGILGQKACLHYDYFFSFRVWIVTKTRIKMVDNILELFLIPFENGIF